MCGHENVHQEVALGAPSWGYGIDAPHVAGANEARQCQNQDASNPLAQNSRLQNDHICPIVVESGPSCPQAQAEAAHTGAVVTPVPVHMVDGVPLKDKSWIWQNLLY